MNSFALRPLSIFSLARVNISCLTPNSPAGMRRMEKYPVSRAMAAAMSTIGGSMRRRLIPLALRARISRSLVMRVKPMITPAMHAMGMT